jgi:large repetitive protein
VPPSGITLSPAGILSGTPTTEGTYLFTVHVTDARGVTATQSFRLVVVKPAPTVTKTKPVAKKKKKRKSTRR